MRKKIDNSVEYTSIDETVFSPMNHLKQVVSPLAKRFEEVS